jgi:hypothetical protein
MDIMASVAPEKKQVARPLKVLVPLIKDELTAGDAAGLEHYRQAGEMLNEAKGQVPHGSWSRWLTKNFELSQTTAKRYMRLARVAKDDDDVFKSTTDGRFRSYREIIGERPAARVAENIQRIRQEALSRQQDRDAARKLAMQLIDIGYKALATKLHPDKGGSREAMMLLNEVRDRLKQHA